MATLRITKRGAHVPDPGNLAIQKGRKSCRHSARKPRLSPRQLWLVRCFVQCRYRSNVQQTQALFCQLTKRKPALVIRAVQLALQAPIGRSAFGSALRGGRHLLAGRKNRPVAGRAPIHHLARYQGPPKLADLILIFEGRLPLVLFCGGGRQPLGHAAPAHSLKRRVWAGRSRHRTSLPKAPRRPNARPGLLLAVRSLNAGGHEHGTTYCK